MPDMYSWRLHYTDWSIDASVHQIGADDKTVFGMSADCHVRVWPHRNEPPSVTVNQGSMSVDIDQALVKHDLYGQVISVAQFIQEGLRRGIPLDQLGVVLEGRLVTVPGKTTERVQLEWGGGNDA